MRPSSRARRLRFGRSRHRHQHRVQRRCRARCLGNIRSVFRDLAVFRFSGFFFFPVFRKLGSLFGSFGHFLLYGADVFRIRVLGVDLLRVGIFRLRLLRVFRFGLRCLLSLRCFWAFFALSSALPKSFLSAFALCAAVFDCTAERSEDVLPPGAAPVGFAPGCIVRFSAFICSPPFLSL